MGKRRGTYGVLVGKPEGKRPFGRPRRRWEDNIKRNLSEVGWGMAWIDLPQNRDKGRILVNTTINLRLPENARNFLTRRGPLRFSRMTLFHGVSLLSNCGLR